MKAYLINMHLLVPNSRSSAKSRSNIKVTFLKKWPFRGHSFFTNTSCLVLLVNSTRFIHMMPLGSKLTGPRGSQIEHRDKETHPQNSSSLKVEGLELWYLTGSISLWTSTTFFSDYAPWVKVGPSPGVTNWNKEAHLQNSFSVKLKGIGLWYLVCSVSLWSTSKFWPYDAPGVKTDPAPGVTILNMGIKKANFKILFSWPWRPRAFIFGI